MLLSELQSDIAFTTEFIINDKTIVYIHNHVDLLQWVRTVPASISCPLRLIFFHWLLHATSISLANLIYSQFYYMEKILTYFLCLELWTSGLPVLVPIVLAWCCGPVCPTGLALRPNSAVCRGHRPKNSASSRNRPNRRWKFIHIQP